MKVTVLRLGHRKERDKRISTHVGLVARAFGANEIVFSGEEDKSIINSIFDVINRWGGSLKVSYVKNWKKFLENLKSKGWKVVHLTMYGMPVQKKLNDLKKEKKIVIVVGSEKVPSEIYQIADYNIAITNQPHSEVAALAVFLHEIFEGKEFNKKFKNWKIKIIPSERNKLVKKK